jgi:GPI-anchor transamidase subunit T
MPYNVIILSSTVIALAFGSIFNLLVRRFVALDPGDVIAGNKLRGLILRFIAFIISRIKSVKNRRRRTTEMNKVVEDDKGNDMGVESS